MNREELKKILDELRKLPAETEWVEFKKAGEKQDFDTRNIGEYFSALSNEANLKGKPRAWLIFGVGDKKHKIVGTTYRPDRKHLDRLKHEISISTSYGITFAEIHELFLPEGRVVMFEIPPAPRGMPVAWKGICYGRAGDSKVPLTFPKSDSIRNQIKPDWSKMICKDASIDDLDPEAIKNARIEFAKKNPKYQGRMDSWGDQEFLNKAKITIRGKITNAALLLLGKPESEHFISPAVAKISWVLKDDQGIEQDYEHFAPPFILNTDVVLSKIRNLNFRYLPGNTLFPLELRKYDTYVIREALHNCIAHQNYELKSRIWVIEKPEDLLFINKGIFIPGSIEAVIRDDSPPEFYRNQFLADAMVNLNMIDTMGSGIRKMFRTQRERYFPMPDYDLLKSETVKVRVLGKILDEKYSRMLINKTDLDLLTVVYLDKVQKKKRLDRTELQHLRKLKLIEGRVPNVFVSSQLASVTGDKVQYIKNRAFADEHYKEMILNYIKKWKSATRKEIDDLLMNILSEALKKEQKKNKIRNLIQNLSTRESKIENKGSRRKPVWVLVK